MGSAAEWIRLEEAVIEYGEHIGRDVLFTVLSYLILDGAIDTQSEETPAGVPTVWVLRMHVERAAARLDRRQWVQLAGQPITLHAAARQCNLPASTFHRWLKRGYLQELPCKGKARCLDAAEVRLLEAMWAMVGKPGRALFPLLSLEQEPGVE